MHQIYHCNITGLQLVKSDPLVKTELALTSDAVNLIGNALTGFKKHNTPIESSALLCDAHDIWNDGQRLNPAIRSMSFTNGVTGHIQTDSRGRRLETMFDGIGRINGKFVKTKKRSTSERGPPLKFFYLIATAYLLKMMSAGRTSITHLLV
ncbi:hypothetical protein L596_001862 [Steinernema carpocapsae]|uniref:Receptor ligand binding region domain-containing protein n=1 Tax=Steinernema carpocapsae TaxID=34508 RepID=A0A4U8URC2_STECR|nr:hypothetical protein L596_001862 [Steinernema carpocapsae]